MTIMTPASEGGTVATIDTGTEDLLAEIDDGVAVVTMNRPGARNALSGAMLDAMARVLADLEIDDGVGCVVLTGAGGAFCAGGDVKGMAERRRRGRRSAPRSTAHPPPAPAAARDVREALSRCPSRPSPRCPAPAAGAGLSLALACDLRSSPPSAVMTTAFAKVGFAGDYGGTWFLSQLVGTAKARELYYLSDRVTADEADAARPRQLASSPTTSCATR